MRGEQLLSGRRNSIHALQDLRERRADGGVVHSVGRHPVRRMPVRVVLPGRRGQSVHGLRRWRVRNGALSVLDQPGVRRVPAGG